MTAEEVAEETGRKRKKSSSKPAELHHIDRAEEFREERISTGFSNLDRVLGGGIVKGALVLLGGEPGIGKSTLMLQLASKVDGNVIYVSGEESVHQIALRASRLGVERSLPVICETDWEAVEQRLLQEKPDIVVVDSIQTMYLPSLPAAAGSVSQVKEVCGRIFRLAKEQGITIFLVGHVTKGGVIAGPKLVEHLVDVVLYFEGERYRNFRILRAVKNRYGATNEIAVFEMTGYGLVPVENPSGFFVTGESSPGTVVFPMLEGKTPILVEIQALVVPSSFQPNPRRVSIGLDPYRVSMLMGVVERHLGLSFASRDVYLNVSGGLRISEPASDLAVVMALISAFTKKFLPEKSVVFGEINLSGSVRPCPRDRERLAEAVRLGYQLAILPPTDVKMNNIKLYEVSSIQEAWRIFE